MQEYGKIKRLILEFPNGETEEICSQIADIAQNYTHSNCSEGGYTWHNPNAQENWSFAEDEMTYSYGYMKNRAELDKKDKSE